MRILGIDYGRKKIGLAVAFSQIAEPYEVIRYDDLEVLGEKIKEVIKNENIEEIVLGISEGEMAEETRRFGEILKEKTRLPLSFSDETLSTYDAQRFSQEAGVKREKRKNFEDAYAATVMLQEYLASR
ncbi:hypothetical protein A2W13_01635 [Candidatus Woesebacteria bacterium RBG_16_36_11]|uniref:Putative pre-16S rRNA nuclease n=3 Tax=Candidatus Woeseibacteriota TaxID=1752722 RepID=A0A1F7XBC9_9BACT|nr:MAG: hypothetical protein A2Z67_03645 [Candidatus Woesebacteria bacterium RBG_13_36_22]OGM12327.1 MAG: hypothetical protein A2W13_01635 [Candidatus Woesebacteria bacterium RBG_16_36_11]OGM17254.1 MAG: hypothetical protein A2V55_01795 [Candidatus Woesebacteria bacterium RBG_19FT_COMBO_37_29]